MHAEIGDRRHVRGRVDATTPSQSQAELTSPTSGFQDDLDFRDDAVEPDLTTEAWPPRPVRPARVGLSPRAHARQFNDPSNYLG